MIRRLRRSLTSQPVEEDLGLRIEWILVDDIADDAKWMRFECIDYYIASELS